MPRKVKPAPITTVIESEEAAESSEVKTEDIPVYPDTPDTETPANETTQTIRRPKKKLRRPTLSDTIPAIPVAAFHRLVREIGDENRIELRWEDKALEALQVDAEAYLIGKFQQARQTLDLFGKSRTVGEKMLRG
jgi:histone H3/H4